MRAALPPTSLALIVAGLSLFTAHCAPPPFALAMEGAHRDPVGSISVGGYATYAGDLTSATSSGDGYPAPARSGVVPAGAFGARVSSQFARNVAVGGEIAGGVASTSQATGLVGARAHVRVHPDSDHFAFVAGVGGGVGISPATSLGGTSSSNYDTSGFGSLDLGARAGTRVADRVDLYAAQTIAMQLIWFRNQTEQPWLFHSVTEVGAIWRVSEQLGIGAHLSMIFRANENGALDRPCFMPSLSARYTFGDFGSRGAR